MQTITKEILILNDNTDSCTNTFLFVLVKSFKWFPLTHLSFWSFIFGKVRVVFSSSFIYRDVITAIICKHMIFWRDNIQKKYFENKMEFYEILWKEMYWFVTVVKMWSNFEWSKIMHKRNLIVCGKVSLYNEVARRCEKSPDSINRYLWPFFGCP